MKDPIIAITPFEQPDARLALALIHSGALPVLDLGRDREAGLAALETLEGSGAPFGVRLSEGCPVGIEELPGTVRAVVLPAPPEDESVCRNRCVLVQVVSLEEARRACRAGAFGLVAKGEESGGRIGSESAFMLFQRLVGEIELPIWVQGGIGPHTAAACIAGGAAGVVVDSQLACLPECSLPDAVKKAVAGMDGSECVVVSGQRILNPPGLCASGREKVPASILLPAGQDAAFASSLAGRYQTARKLVGGILEAMETHLGQARALRPLACGSPLAEDHNTHCPVVQGPMSRVSDRAAFAEAVAEAGGLPMLGLSMLRGECLDDLLEKTKKRLGDRPWGVGILGFAPAEIREEQHAAIIKARPQLAIIAGGRPSQARSLEEAGIATYLHVPSPGLLDLFLQDGARRFIFEGRECGGHIGPRSSLVLWEEQIERLCAFESPEEVSVLFAGGIHDARSAAMVAAAAAPLSAKGVKVGVLMGTAYLLTEEAVSTGAIVPGFQEALLACRNTTVLQTAPGHAARCADTDFAKSFSQRRRELEESGKSREEVWAELEKINLGRLRIAAKGERQTDEHDDHFEPVDADAQRKEGMFMAGQVAALNDRVLTMAGLHREVTQGATELLERAKAPGTNPDQARPADVAIVGMACVFPGSPELDDYWANIVSGRNTITEVPRERWNQDIYYSPDATIKDGGSKTVSKWGGFIPPVDFDPVAYGIPPMSIAAIEPIQLLSLEVASRALKDAGYHQREFNRARTSVFFGAESGTDLSGGYSFRALYPMYCGELPEALDKVLPAVTEDSFPGIIANVIAGRIANRLDLGGANYTVDAACASSLAALDVACKELLAGSSDMVLCGGADLHNSINDYLMFSSVGILSPKGKCRTFDAKADGIVLGEGISVAVLKRLDDAVRDGDKVYAVIKAVAGTSDGRAVGLTVPHKEGQKRVVRRAFQNAGVSPREVELVEAHGTGTVVGDRTELATLTDVFTAAGKKPQSCALGSVKSQIGHTKCAAGMAGLIKAALSIYHRTLPPTLHIEKPNPGYDPKTSPFTFSDQSRPWPGTDQKAGLSAFGFGGANFHAVLTAHENGSEPKSNLSAWPAELFIFKAKTRDQALDTAKKIAELLAIDAPVRLRDLAHSVSRSGEGPVQFALVARDLEDLQQKLQNQEFFEPSEAEGRVAFLFPGQGSQRPGMLADLFVAFPQLRRFLDLGDNWLGTIFPSQAGAAEKQALAETQVAQPAMGMADLAMAELLKLFGIKPDMLAGHSYGELVALCVAGALLEEELLDLSAARGQSIVAAAGSEKGAMLAVRAKPEEVEDIPGVVVANHNAPDQTVLSGPVEAIETAQETIKARGISATRIPVSCAFHSPMVAAASETFADVLADKTVRTPEMPVWSNTTCEPYPEEANAIRERLAEHLAKPVRFADQIQSMYAAGARIFVEVGPGRVLTGLVRKILKGKPHTVISCDEPGQPGIESLLQALAQLSVLQLPIDTEALFADRNTRPFDLETPPTRPASTWQVNGHRAVPLNGELPDFAMHPVTEPLNIAPTPTAGTNRETVVLEYLKSMREIVRDQREVMLRYLGSAPAELPAIIETTAVKQLEPEPEPVPVPEPADVGTLLLQIVSERTGYPTDMLDLNLDLAADLSIDSIKRIEIIGELCKRMGLGQGDMARRDEVIEELASQKTLKNILTWLEKQKDKASPTQDSTPAQKTEVQESLNRYVLSVEPAPAVSQNDRTTAGKTFALTDDGLGVAKALAERLTDSGAKVHLLNGSGMSGKVDGLIHLQSLDPKPGADQVKRLFSLAQEALLDGAGTILAATGHGGAFGREKPGNNGSFLQGGVSGLVKTVAKEWPEARVRVVDMDPEEAPGQMADALYEELLSHDDLVEVGHRQGVRHVLQPVEADKEPAVDLGALDLNQDSVVLLTGGARGITAHVALELARRFRPRLVLLGRSPLPGEESDPELAQAKDLAGLRGVLASRGRGLKPAEIDREAKKILSAREIRNTLASIREAGAEVEYHPVDVRDHEAFSACIEDLYARHGRIDGVIHGAGVLDDKLIRDKTLESFSRVFDTKVAGALTLAEKLKDDVRFVVFFSSVSGAFGNRGQVDYAAANDALDKLALSLNHRLSGRVVSINWGPWAGTGMVSEQLEAEYAKHGIGIIPPEEGAQSLIAELGRGSDSDAQVILMRAKPEHFC